MNRFVACRTTVTWVVVAIVASMVAGCGGADRRAGRRPVAPMNAARVAATEVFAGAGEAPFTFTAAPGGLLVVTFGFVSCPDVCPATLGNLRSALETLGPDADRVRVAFVTVDINRDTATVLIPFLRSFVGNGHALRPRNQAELGRIEAAFGATSSVTRDATGEIQVRHTPLTYVVNESGDVVLQWDFGTPGESMARELRSLLAAGDDAPASGGPLAAGGAPAEAGTTAAPVPADADPAAAPGAIRVEGAWARETPAMAKAGAAYLTLTSAHRDRLVAANLGGNLAARVELHEVFRDPSGGMTMRRVPSIELPAGGRVALEPGGYHLMLVGLRRSMVAGDTLDLILRFERAPAIAIRMPVRRT